MAESRFPERVQHLVDETTETLSSAPRRLVQASRGAINMTREEADHLLSRGESLFDRLVERGRKVEDEQTGRLEGWFKGWSDRGRKQFHMAEEQLEQQVQAVLSALHIPSSDDVARLDKEIDRISKKLNAYLARQAEQVDLPIEGYADMTVKEITPLLEGMDAEELRAIQTFELAHSARKTVLREIDSKLEAQEA
jgi:polyhydroxyalkanoate synthesis regulator phasin